MAAREALSTSCCKSVPWGSKSFSPRRGSVGVGVVLVGRGEGEGLVWRGGGVVEVGGGGGGGGLQGEGG